MWSLAILCCLHLTCIAIEWWNYRCLTCLSLYMGFRCWVCTSSTLDLLISPSPQLWFLFLYYFSQKLYSIYNKVTGANWEFVCSLLAYLPLDGFNYVYVWIITHVLGASGGQKTASWSPWGSGEVFKPLGLKLQIAMSHPMGAKVWIRVFWKSSQWCCSPLSSLSTHIPPF